MTGIFATAIIVFSLLLAAWTGIEAIRGRALSRPVVIAAGVLEALLVVFLVGGIIQMIGSDAPFSRFVVLAYLVGLVLIPPLGLLWAWEEKSRTASVVALIVFLVIPIMVVRVQQVWAHG